MLVHTVHAENEASESPPRVGSHAAARIQPGHHPGLPLHVEEEGEEKSRHCWDVCIVPPRCQASLTTAPQCYHAPHRGRDCSRRFFLPSLDSLPPCARCSGCGIQPRRDEPRCPLTRSRREEGQGYIPYISYTLSWCTS